MHVVQEPVVRRGLVRDGQGLKQVVAARVITQGEPSGGLDAETLVRVGETCGQYVKGGRRVWRRCAEDGARHPADRRLGVGGALYDGGERIRGPCRDNAVQPADRPLTDPGIGMPGQSRQPLLGARIAGFGKPSGERPNHPQVRLLLHPRQKQTGQWPVVWVFATVVEEVGQAQHFRTEVPLQRVRPGAQRRGCFPDGGVVAVLQFVCRRPPHAVVDVRLAEDRGAVLVGGLGVCTRVQQRVNRFGVLAAHRRQQRLHAHAPVRSPAAAPRPRKEPR